jgi:hypothetical protein
VTAVVVVLWCGHAVWCVCKCTVVASGVGVHGIDDGDEGEAGEVTVFQAVLRHVEERRMRQHALQEDLRLELELTREVRRCSIAVVRVNSVQSNA